MDKVTSRPSTPALRRSMSSLTELDKMYKKGWGVIVRGPLFENGSVLIIVLYVIWLGVDIDWNRPDSDVQPIVFEVVDNVFCGLFVLEISFRFWCYRRKRDFFTDKDMRNWNIFDSVLVLLMVIETWIISYVFQADVSELQMFSVLRLLRLLRVSRLLRHLPELRIMVLGLVEALRSVTAAFLLGVGFMYIWSVVFTQWTISYGSKGKCIGEKDYEICLEFYFGSLGKSFLTFTQILVFDDTFELVRPIIKEHFLMGMLIILYILLESFTILSMLIGIICDIVQKTTIREKRLMMESRIKILFENIDADGSKCITREEFNGEAKEALLELGLENRIVEHVFDLSDFDRSGTLDLQEFMSTITLCTSPPSGREVQQVFSQVERVCGAVGLDSNTTAILKREKGRTAKSRMNLDQIQGRNSESQTSVAADVEKVRDQFSKLQAIIYRAELDAEKRSRSLRLNHGLKPPLLPPKQVKWFRRVQANLPKLCSQLHALRAEYRFTRSRHTEMRDIDYWQLDECMTEVIQQIGSAMGTAPATGLSRQLSEKSVELPTVVDLDGPNLSARTEPSALPKTLLAAPALAGSTSLIVRNATGFELGSHIMIGSGEIKTVVGVMPGISKNSIVLSSSTTQLHVIGTIIRKLQVNDPQVKIAGAGDVDVPLADPNAARQRAPRPKPTDDVSVGEDISSDFDVSSVPTDDSMSEAATKLSTRQRDAGGGAFSVNEVSSMNVNQVAVFPAYSEGESVEYFSTTDQEWKDSEISVQVIKDKSTGQHSHFVYSVRIGGGASEVRNDVTLDVLRLPPSEKDLVEIYKTQEFKMGGTWVGATVQSSAWPLGYNVKLVRGAEVMRVPSHRIRYLYKAGDTVLYYRSPEIGWVKAIVDRSTSPADGLGREEAGLDLASRKFHTESNRNRGSSGAMTFAGDGRFTPRVLPWTIVNVRSGRGEINQFAETVPSYYVRPNNTAHAPTRILMASSNQGQKGGLFSNLRSYLQK